MGSYRLAFVLALVVISVAVYLAFSWSGWSSPYCGNGMCELNEGCDSCYYDCKCAAGFVCFESADTCIEENTCGNGMCESAEKIQGTCCMDCGCSEGKVCDMYTDECKDYVNLPDDTLKVIVSLNLSERGINPDDVTFTIRDSYFESEIVKEVIVTYICGDLYCTVVYYINKEGKIIEDEGVI